MTCLVVRSTGKVRATSNPDSVSGSFAALPAVGNHVIVKCWGSDDDSAFDFGTGAVTDNQGNTYTRDVHPATAQIAASGFYHNCSIFSCKVGTSSGTFTVTANPAGAGSFGAIVFEAEEVSGLDPTAWFDVGASASGNTNAPATGNTPSIANADSYQASVLSCAEAGGDGIFTSITVESVTPAWTQRAEELDGDTYEGGESDSRILTTTGAKSCSWSTSNTGNAYWVCATGVYKGAGTQSFSYSASGGLSFSGSAARARVRAAAPAGGLAFAGASAFAKGQTVTPASGGIQFGGAIAEVRVRAVIATGGLQFGGAAGLSTHEAARTVLATGGFQFGGAASYSTFTVGGGQSELLQRARRRWPR